jgi:hypothetical protein
MWCDRSGSLVLVRAFADVLARVNNQLMTQRRLRRISPPTKSPFAAVVGAAAATGALLVLIGSSLILLRHKMRASGPTPEDRKEQR